MNEIYETAFKDELEKIAADDKKPSRTRSAAKGALTSGIHIGTIGGLLGVGKEGLKSKLEKSISKITGAKMDTYIKKLRKAIKPNYLKGGLKAALILGAAGSILGGVRGALYPEGRKNIWSGKRSPVGK